MRPSYLVLAKKSDFTGIFTASLIKLAVKLPKWGMIAFNSSFRQTSGDVALTRVVAALSWSKTFPNSQATRLNWALASRFLLAIILAFLPSVGKAQSLVRDAEIESTLRHYSDPIFEAAGLNPKDVKIFIVGDRTLNAFVTNGQNVFLHTGLILETATPNQLKGVIAHETGHISGGHLARSDANMRAAMTPAYITVALGLIAIAAGAPDAGAALLASSQQFALLSFFTFTRVQESSADQAALTFLEKTGQSGRGLIEFFTKFRYNEILGEARREPYFRSHPLSGDRIQALQNRVNEQVHKDAVDSPADIDRLKMAQAKIQGFLYTPARTFVKYPQSDQSIYARYARAVAAFRAPDLLTATRETNKLIAEQPNNPYFHELLGQIYYENGKSIDSVAPNRRAVELAPNEALLRIGLARSLIATEKAELRAEAETNLREALRLDSENAFAWNQLAIIADRNGQTGLARLATAEEAYALGDVIRANRFAQVALRNLARTTPQWQRASDIDIITAPLAAKAARQAPGGGRRLSSVVPLASEQAVSNAATPEPYQHVDHVH
jgi:predicted Zn-dependent protease